MSILVAFPEFCGLPVFPPLFPFIQSSFIRSVFCQTHSVPLQLNRNTFIYSFIANYLQVTIHELRSCPTFTSLLISTVWMLCPHYCTVLCQTWCQIKQCYYFENLYKTIGGSTSTKQQSAERYLTLNRIDMLILTGLWREDHQPCKSC